MQDTTQSVTKLFPTKPVAALVYRRRNGDLAAQEVRVVSEKPSGLLAAFLDDDGTTWCRLIRPADVLLCQITTVIGVPVTQ